MDFKTPHHHYHPKRTYKKATSSNHPIISAAFPLKNLHVLLNFFVSDFKLELQ